jgi:hypothetical protein
VADLQTQKSIGELVDERALSQALAWTAATASDAATWTGVTIDRMAFSGILPRTMDAAVFYDATLGSGQTLSLTCDLQDSPDGATWSDYATSAATVVVTGVSGGGRAVGVARFAAPLKNVNAPPGTPGVGLSSARRYVRFNVLPHLSRTGTDTAVIASIGVFAGFEVLPAPQL